MSFCDRCRRSIDANRWEFCPLCGSALSDTAPPQDAGSAPPQSAKDLLVAMALDAAQRFVESRVQQKLRPLTRILQTNTAGASGAEKPHWYSAAVNGQQPTMDPAELALLQAQEITKTRTAVQMAEAAIATSRSINDRLLPRS